MPFPALLQSRRWLLLTVAALAAGGLALLVFRRWRGPRAEPTRVAVAVFVNRTGDPSLEPLGTMAADWVTRGLTQTSLVDVVDVGAIHVQGRSPGGAPTDPYELARRNGAGTVVAGSYYLATDTLVVRATIEDAVTGTVLQTVPPVHVRADAAVRALDQLRERVVVALAAAFDVRAQPFLALPSTPRSFTAYQSFVAGQAAYWHGRSPPEVRSLFQKAVAEDSTFYASEVWLAFIGANGAGCSLTDSVAAAMSPRREALPAFDRLTLDISAARCRNDWGDAFRLAREQASLRPRSTYALYTAGFFGLTSGHFAEAHDLLTQIDPRRDLGWLPDPAKIIYWRDLTSSQHLLGRYEETAQAMARLVRDFPDRLAPRLYAAQALAGLGRSAEALDHVRKIVTLAPDSAAHMAVSSSPGGAAYTVASELLAHGDRDAARVAAQLAVDWYLNAPARVTGRYERLQFARAYVVLGRYDEAVAVLAFAPDAVDNDPHYLALRGWIAARQGNKASVEEIDGRLARMNEPSVVILAETARARIAAGMRERDRAIELLERSSARGMVRSAVGNDMHSDPLYEELRGDPRFERLNRGR